jgi:hypothetical protein
VDQLRPGLLAIVHALLVNSAWIWLGLDGIGFGDGEIFFDGICGGSIRFLFLGFFTFEFLSLASVWLKEVFFLASLWFRGFDHILSHGVAMSVLMLVNLPVVHLDKGAVLT